MLVTLEIESERIQEFINLVQKFKGFLGLKKIQEPETMQDIVLTKTYFDLTSLKMTTPFLTLTDIDTEINSMREEWESNI